MKRIQTTAEQEQNDPFATIPFSNSDETSPHEYVLPRPGVSFDRLYRHIEKQSMSSSLAGLVQDLVDWEPTLEISELSSFSSTHLLVGNKTRDDKMLRRNRQRSKQAKRREGTNGSVFVDEDVDVVEFVWYLRIALRIEEDKRRSEDVFDLSMNLAVNEAGGNSG